MNIFIPVLKIFHVFKDLLQPCLQFSVVNSFLLVMIKVSLFLCFPKAACLPPARGWAWCHQRLLTTSLKCVGMDWKLSGSIRWTAGPGLHWPSVVPPWSLGETWAWEPMAATQCQSWHIRLPVTWPWMNGCMSCCSVAPRACAWTSPPLRWWSLPAVSWHASSTRWCAHTT